MRVKEVILNFLFPTSCLFCGYKNEIVCLPCFNKIPKRLVIKDNILSIYEYRNKEINKLLWKLKYHHNHEIAKKFGEVLKKEMINYFDSNTFLIPIPLNKNDKRIHNHVELIANNISENVLPNFLIKNSKLKQAHTKSKKERFENIKNSFSINPKCLPPPPTPPRAGGEKNKFIIIDDVTTTGATINEARRVVAKYLQINEKDIFAVVVAR